jgi:hypothetical protein
MKWGYDSEISIIENNLKAAQEYGLNCGYSVVKLEKKHLKALEEGKCIAFDDGEYSTFLILKEEEE